MATKNIARTAIEGGRVKSNKHERWQSNREERRAASVLMTRIMTDTELATEAIFPERDQVRKEFKDKLAAPAKWFAKKMNGLGFDDIRGNLLRTFDTRSLAGRHLVFDHLMPNRDSVTARPQTGSYKDRLPTGFDENEVFRVFPNQEAWRNNSNSTNDGARYSKRSQKREHFKLAKPEADWWITWKLHEYVWMKYTGRTISVKCRNGHCKRRTKWYATRGPDAGRYVYGPHWTANVNGNIVPAHTEWEKAIVRPLTDAELNLFDRLFNRDDRADFMRPPYRHLTSTF